jgi:uncharacterized protein YjcR
MHGGSQGSGAPANNRNALKHGRYTRQMREQRQVMAAFIRECEDMLCDLE